MIKLGLYGCGKRTKALLDSLCQDNFYKVQAAYDLNGESVASHTAAYGGRGCNTPEVVKSIDVDAFLISLSPFAHADALRQQRIVL